MEGTVQKAIAMGIRENFALSATACFASAEEKMDTIALLGFEEGDFEIVIHCFDVLHGDVVGIRDILHPFNFTMKHHALLHMKYRKNIGTAPAKAVSSPHRQVSCLGFCHAS